MILEIGESIPFEKEFQRNRSLSSMLELAGRSCSLQSLKILRILKRYVTKHPQIAGADIMFPVQVDFIGFKGLIREFWCFSRHPLICRNCGIYKIKKPKSNFLFGSIASIDVVTPQ
jgi:hypothetical protein